jgi:predicted nucleic acid-binding protein
MICLELLGGTKSPSEFNRPKNRLGAPHQMPADEATWETAVQLSYKFRHRGKIIPYTDILIASAAVINERTLLHADRHFDLMAQDTDLKVRSVGE